MQIEVVPILMLSLAASLLGGGMLLAGKLLGPRRQGAVKRMPYESGMDPIHDTRRRFDIRFHLVAIAFLIFDVELLFLYPWAVAAFHPQGIDAAVADGLVADRGFVFAGVVGFFVLLVVGFVYDWRKGVFQWR